MSARGARADVLFAAYVSAGRGLAHYSLDAFRADLASAGVTVSLGTLKRYSAQDDWQARAALIWERQAAEEVPDLQRARLAMEARHARLAQALTGAGATALQELLSDRQRRDSMRPSEIARLLDLGVRVERNALHTATDLEAMVVETWNTVVASVSQLFEAVNGLPVADDRAACFANALDALVDLRLRDLRKKGV